MCLYNVKGHCCNASVPQSKCADADKCPKKKQGSDEQGDASATVAEERKPGDLTIM